MQNLLCWGVFALGHLAQKLAFVSQAVFFYLSMQFLSCCYAYSTAHDPGHQTYKSEVVTEYRGTSPLHDASLGFAVRTPKRKGEKMHDFFKSPGHLIPGGSKAISPESLQSTAFCFVICSFHFMTGSSKLCFGLCRTRSSTDPNDTLTIWLLNYCKTSEFVSLLSNQVSG